MIGAIAIGIAGGVVAGLLGVGGGVLFVPGLVFFLGLDQHHAEATSLLAIVPVAIVGTLRNDRYGNVRRDDALVMGLLSLAGAAAGVALANQLSGTVLRDAFAALMVLVAVQLVRNALRRPPAGAGSVAAEAAPSPTSLARPENHLD
ncbi:MAG: TSUP family transporter [Solirubrobacteraceae bacterium]